MLASDRFSPVVPVVVGGRRLQRGCLVNWRFGYSARAPFRVERARGRPGDIAGGQMRGNGQSAHRPASRAVRQARPADVMVRRTMVLGYSVRHRPVIAVELGDPDSLRRVLVVGCIHGSEPAGIAIGIALARGSPPAQADLWIVPDLNPDGVAAGTRQNARGWT